MMLKKKLVSALAALCITTSAVPTAAAVRNVPVTVDGITVIEEARLEKGVTSVPLRTLLDAIGGWNIYWDRSTRSAVASNGSTTIIATPGKYEITVDGDTRATTCAVYIEDGRTYVPLRVLGNSLGWAVDWDRLLGGATVTTESGDWTEEDLYWLSRVISAESRGESLTGQMAVGNVVLNRMTSADFPNTIKEVVFDKQHGTQFEPVDNGTIYDAPTKSSIAAAKAVLAGQSVVGDCLYFYAPALSQGTWINENRMYYTTIGCHRFYL